jgi:nucleotide-binding universal stress UspA family protein
MRIIVRPCPPIPYSCRILVRVRNQPIRASNETLTNEIVYRAFRFWAEKYRLSDADSHILQDALNEARQEGKDLTLGEAIDKVKRASSIDEGAGNPPWSTISEMIDWNKITGEEALRGQALEASEVVKAALEQGLISPKDIGLYRRPPSPPVQKLTSKAREYFERQLQDYENRVKKLEQQLKEAQERQKTPEDIRNEEKVRQLNIYIQQRGEKEGLTSADIMILTGLIDTKATLEQNMRRIEDEIYALKITTPRALPRPPVNPNVPAVDIIRLKSAYLKDKGSLTTGELVALINTLLALDTEGRCDPECQEILADYFKTQEELRRGQMRKEQERFGIQDQRLRYSARVMYEGKVVSDNLFSTREEAIEKAAQIELLISKGVFSSGTTVSVVDTFEEAGKGLE